MIPIKTINIDFYAIKKTFIEMVNSKLVHQRKNQNIKNAEVAQVYKEVNIILDKFNISERLEDIIFADFDTLKKVKNIFDNNNCIYDAYEGNDTKKKYVRDSPFNKLYKAFERLDNHWLIKELGITVCPYCNRDFINNRGSSTSAQLDHFYPRSKYPIFSVSIHNLIPCCYACNHIKLDKAIDISPYDQNFDFNTALKFSYTPLSFDYLYDHTKLEVLIKCNNQILKNISTMKIDNAYKLHTDYVQELIKKSIIYNNIQIKEYLREYPNLFTSKEEVLRIVFGNYIDENELGKRPLAKLTKDILNELGVNL